MNNVPSPIENENSDYGAEKIRADLRRLERRDIWAWMNAVVIILGLTGAVFSLSASLQWMGMKTVLGVDYRVAVRALVILVLAFTMQTIYQQIKVRKLQRELEEQHVQAEVFRRLAMFDPLTGLYNRRFAEQRLKAEIARSERRGHALIVVLVDLNDFKEINDKYGHQTGDLVLKEFAKRLSSSTRGSDVAARWGGDEFMMLLVDCEVEQLSRVLVRLEGFEVQAERENIAGVGGRRLEGVRAGRPCRGTHRGRGPQVVLQQGNREETGTRGAGESLAATAGILGRSQTQAQETAPLFICGTTQAVEEVHHHDRNQRAGGIQKRIPRAGAARSHKRLVNFVQCGVPGGNEPGKHRRRQVPSAAHSSQPAIKKQKENEVLREMRALANDVVNEVERCRVDPGKEPAKNRLNDAASVLRREKIGGSNEDHRGPQQRRPPGAQPVGE